MIAIVDYGLGNVQALINVYKGLGIPARLAKCADDLTGATLLILPGVGAFDWAMTRLNESGMRGRLDDLVLVEKKPVLGVCVGMQMMARGSDEGSLPGLAWLDADVKLLAAAEPAPRLCLPHMGWNDVEPVTEVGLFDDLGRDAQFYFLHSYCVVPRAAGDVLATSVYGTRFACAVRRANVHGVQFHPEKSHRWGERLLKNFAGL